MKAALYVVPGRHHETHLTAMGDGLKRHGVEVEGFTEKPAKDADIAVTWSWRVGLRIREQGFSKPILVMERGYIGDRHKFTSVGWNGLNGRASFPKPLDSDRFKKNFGHLLRPWKGEAGYALIAGQVKGDTALIGVDIHDWYRKTAVALYKKGWDVKFRQHPVEIERRIAEPPVPFAEYLNGTLDNALSGASLVVTYNSNAGVDAILAGCPVHAEDEGSMVYSIASHDLEPIRPERESRLHEIAWCQYTMDEIRSGFAWDMASWQISDTAQH